MMKRLAAIPCLLCAFAAIAADAVPPPIDVKAVAPKRRGVISMPAIGSPGQPAIPVKQNIVRITEGVNEMVYIALGVPNRITTPFDDPLLIEAVGLQKDQYKKVGRDIYVTPDAEVPIGAFITDKANPGRAAALTLIPRPGIPGQSIFLVLDDANGRISGDVAKTEMAAPAADYVDGLKQLLRVFVQGGIPHGYQEGTLNVGAARAGAAMVVPERIYNGSPYHVYRYRVENAGRDVIELNEASFHEDGVRAVAFWPTSKLAPSESTRVYIVADPQGGER